MSDITLPSRIAVLGFGTMGAGIAQVVAANGATVVVLEADQARIDAGLHFVRTFLDAGVRRGKVTEDERDAILGRFEPTTSVEDLADVGAVIESVTERAEVKKDLLARVAAVVGPEVPLLTNTSALSVSDIATAVPNPGRVAGLHFFNPAPVMPTVEVVRAVQTDEEIVAWCAALVESWQGKSPVVVNDRPGFLVNALLIPYLNDVVHAYDDELASAADIDTALKLGLGYKAGPLELLDMIGLDVHMHASESAYEATRDPRYAPPPLLQKMVAAGRLGAKSGAGFRLGQE